MRSSSPSSSSYPSSRWRRTRQLTCSCPRQSVARSPSAAAPVVLAVTMRARADGIALPATSFNVGSFFQQFGQKPGGAPSAASAFSAQAADSVLLLNQSEAVNASVRSRLSQSARPSMSSRPGMERIVVTLRRGPTGGLGLGLSPGNLCERIASRLACGGVRHDRTRRSAHLSQRPARRGRAAYWAATTKGSRDPDRVCLFTRAGGESLPPSVRGESGRTDEEGPEEIGEEESDEAIATQLQAEEEDIAAAVAQSNIFDDAVTPINNLAAEIPLGG